MTAPSSVAAALEWAANPGVNGLREDYPQVLAAALRSCQEELAKFRGFNNYEATAERAEKAEAELASATALFVAKVGELYDELAAERAECMEQARLNGMGGEREARLMAELAAFKSCYEEMVAGRAKDVHDICARVDAARKERDSALRQLGEARLLLNGAAWGEDERCTSCGYDRGDKHGVGCYFGDFLSRQPEVGK